MKTRMFIAITALVLGVTFNAVATPIPIDTATIYLTIPNTGLSAYTGPFASIEIDLMTPTSAIITATGLSTYRLGGVDALALRTVGGNATATDFSFVGGHTSSNPITAFTQLAGNNVSEFGFFNVRIRDNDGFTDAVNSVTFTLTDNSIFHWTSALGVLTENNAGYLAAGHIFPNDGFATGFAGNGSTRVPEPGMLMMFGSGLLGLGFFGRKKFKK